MDLNDLRRRKAVVVLSWCSLKPSELAGVEGMCGASHNGCSAICPMGSSACLTPVRFLAGAMQRTKVANTYIYIYTLYHIYIYMQHRQDESKHTAQTRQLRCWGAHSEVRGGGAAQRFGGGLVA